MNKKHLENAFNQLSDKHIREAAEYKRPRMLPYMSAIAACLVCAILLSVFAPKGQTPSVTDPTSTATQPQVPDGYTPPKDFQGTLTPVTIKQSTSSALLSAPVYPLMAPYSTDNYAAWSDSLRRIHYTDLGYANNLDAYFKKICPTVLSQQSGNGVFSPLNIYMALAMLAETTEGESRQQILNLLNAEDLDALRHQAEQLWRAHYYNDGLATSILGSSLWLDDSYTYNEDTVKSLADYYYASVFRGDLGTAAMDDTLRQWLNDNTGDLLKDQVSDVTLPPDAALALATTIFYQVQWNDPLSGGHTGIFHAPSGDRQVEFLHDYNLFGKYYWGEDFGATCIGLRDGSRMWLILPDEGKTPQDLLKSGYAMDMVLNNRSYQQYKQMQVSIDVPKFDITSDLQLKDALKALGVANIFGKDADFTAILPEEDNAHIKNIQHAARLMMDEEGISASAYTIITVYGVSEPLTDRIDLVFDRPFLFVVESKDGLPIFAGTVCEP